jgi:acetylornithine deacetylase/succinyl-diaminopimelate desuccinylase-like protein
LIHEGTLVKVINTLQHLNIDETTSFTSDALAQVFEGVNDDITKNLIDTMSSSLISATIIHGGARNNKVEKNYRSCVDFDCRLLPHISKEEFQQKIEEALQEFPVDIEYLSFSLGYESTSTKQMEDLMLSSLRKADESITSVHPFITPGSNDGKYLHPLGCEVFGFAPVAKREPFTQILPLIHGIDERISVESVDFCYQVLRELVTNILEGEEA